MTPALSLMGSFAPKPSLLMLTLPLRFPAVCLHVFSCPFTFNDCTFVFSVGFSRSHLFTQPDPGLDCLLVSLGFQRLR